MYVTKERLNRISSLYSGLKTPNDEYTHYELIYELDGKTYGNRFELSIFTFFNESEDANRPGYKINDFAIHQPATNKGRFSLPWDTNFPCKKFNEEYYDIALDSIRDIISKFVNNTNLMDKLYTNARQRNRNMQKQDFVIALQKIYGDVINY